MVLIQSRMASSRLPAKALLPVAGQPAVVLCARRASNAGMPVTIATSEAQVDDSLARAVSSAGFPVFRGSHHDVLARFTAATGSLPPDSLVVRLTADNLFPDGEFVGLLIEAMRRADAEYVGTSSPLDGLPYGMSAEVFTVDALRRAAEAAVSAADREHVTPWIRRHCRVARFAFPDAPAHWARLRCTMDTFDDYMAVSAAFGVGADAATLPWRTLVESLATATPGGSAGRVPFRVSLDGRVHSRLTLGTAQLGVAYGIANSAGMPADQHARDLLAVACDAGITHLDTARAYGVSEERIGRLLPANYLDRVTVVTKLAPLNGIAHDASAAALRTEVDLSLFTSLYQMRRRRLDVVLLHRHGHRLAWGGAVWSRLLELREEGLIGDLGVSVASEVEAMEALADPDVAYLQCPVNVLDHRWRSPEFLAAVAGRPDVVVHARSALLQGLLTLPSPRWPRIEGVDPLRIIRTLDEVQAECGRSNRVDFCLAYVAALPWVTSIVMGCETAAQLRDNLDFARRAPLTEAQIARVAESFGKVPDQLLNPARWTEAA
jgi:spore coat polysaccharide biosynthesis protein SpsF